MALEEDDAGATAAVSGIFVNVVPRYNAHMAIVDVPQRTFIPLEQPFFFDRQVAREGTALNSSRDAVSVDDLAQ
jgi:hypothetical protein